MIPETLTNRQNLQLTTYHWPVEKPRAAILLVHGYAEHLGRYEWLVAALNNAGFAIGGVDVRTHGQSEGTPRAYTKDFIEYIEDIELVWAEIQKTYSDLPKFVIGHSMGGNLALRFALRHPDELAGVVTSGAGLSAGLPTPIYPFLKFLASIAPRAVTPPIPASNLTRRPDYNAQFATDPYTYKGWLRFAFAWALLESGAYVYDHAGEFKLPMLLLHGEADKVVPKSASQDLFAKLKTDDKTLKLLPDLYHEIFSEPERDKIFEIVIGWLNNHLE